MTPRSPTGPLARLRRRGRPDGERPLASARTTHGAEVHGTRDALVLPDRRLPWEDVADAAWDADDDALTVRTTGGETLRLPLDDAGRLLQLVRERVTRSVVLRRQRSVAGRLGVAVSVRRRGDGSLLLVEEIDAGLDPASPRVHDAVTALRVELAAEVGVDLGSDPGTDAGAPGPDF
ncbi:hypothetical protein K8Z61_15185 [Nocardioides sp. TRM66260-LWL]|uniref:hypothetical protein n=1 Tax=Nocardioides sp. TRM66260-LWL TaxID=2874478 RepID=UPI001CC383AC|nr:hypothetical protein [Nocardioides sp. TRM66260-LWL]MBZ5735836.1 hypothetical protein [Nocardioides sp. TRM66260-LWL]